MIHRSIYAEDIKRVRAYQYLPPYAKAIGRRKVWVEPLFGEAKDWHGLCRFRLRGLVKVNGETLLIAAGQNLKRLLSRRGWGRRPSRVALQACLLSLALTGTFHAHLLIQVQIVRAMTIKERPDDLRQRALR